MATRRLFTTVRGREWKHGVALCVDGATLSRLPERFADHTVSGTTRDQPGDRRPRPSKYPPAVTPAIEGIGPMKARRYVLGGLLAVRLGEIFWCGDLYQPARHARLKNAVRSLAGSLLHVVGDDQAMMYCCLSSLIRSSIAMVGGGSSEQRQIISNTSVRGGFPYDAQPRCPGAQSPPG